MTERENSNPKPSPYPQTDAAEVRAVSIFENSIDSSRVKADISVRDKTPDVDGFLTLVDESLRPIGKFEVQIRAIPKGKTSYSCPTTLVAYSKVCFSPVLLVCVDISSELIYWKHIHDEMREYKPDQKSFTVHFDNFEKIDNEQPYFEMWCVILATYHSIRLDALKLRTSIQKELSLTGLPPSLVSAFQLYLDTLNTILDTEFKLLKKLFFPTVWKFGVALFKVDDDSISFREYAIDNGHNGPLLIQLHETNGSPISSAQTALAQIFVDSDIQEEVLPKSVKRHEFLRPELLAMDFLYEIYSSAIQQRLFLLGSEFLYRETIFAFVDKFHTTLGAECPQETIDIDQMLHAGMKYLPAWWELAIELQGFCFDPYSSNQLPSLDGLVGGDYNLQQGISRTELDKFLEDRKPHAFRCLYFSHVYFRQFIDALRSLKYNGVQEIQRPYKHTRSKPITLDGSVNQLDLKHNLSLIFNNVLAEYRQFVKANQLFRLYDCDHLNSDYAFAYFAELERLFKEPNAPKVTECKILDPQRSQPKSALYFHAMPGRNTVGGLAISIDGKLLRTPRQGDLDIRFLLTDRPMQEFIYDWLLRLDGSIYDPNQERLMAFLEDD